MSNENNVPLSKIYPSGLLNLFPGLEEIRGRITNEQKTVSAITKPENLNFAIEDLISITRILTSGINESKLSTHSLLKKVAGPSIKAGIKNPLEAWTVGKVTKTSGITDFVLLSDQRKINRHNPAKSIDDLTILLQRISPGVTTIHHYQKQGIKLFLTLEKDIVFEINNKIYRPKTLEEVIVILPGDKFRLWREGGGTASNLIISAYGISPEVISSPFLGRGMENFFPRTKRQFSINM